MPVAVSAEWSSTPVTTDPPRVAEHLEWDVAFTLRAPGPICVAALLMRGSETHWGLQTAAPAAELELRASFSPWRWRTSEGVQINFQGAADASHRCRSRAGRARRRDDHGARERADRRRHERSAPARPRDHARVHRVRSGRHRDPPGSGDGRSSRPSLRNSPSVSPRSRAGTRPARSSISAQPRARPTRPRRRCGGPSQVRPGPLAAGGRRRGRAGRPSRARGVASGRTRCPPRW